MERIMYRTIQNIFTSHKLSKIFTVKKIGNRNRNNTSLLRYLLCANVKKHKMRNLTQTSTIHKLMHFFIYLYPTFFRKINKIY